MSATLQAFLSVDFQILADFSVEIAWGDRKYTDMFIGICDYRNP